MNRLNIKPALMLFSLMMLFSVTLYANPTSGPAVSQKDAINHMHHALHDAQASFKATEAKALKELNEMTIREGVNMDDIKAKIAELMAAKTQIMTLRYEHLVEMRAVLSEDQKIAYDKAVLKRSAVK